ncbi:hypothetical protein NC651_013489 [Populus alba x Populus x berolinensis]|nr:hypothetical protein NC651_013489 [Populus alba x Populus x berolinensis]
MIITKTSSFFTLEENICTSNSSPEGAKVEGLQNPRGDSNFEHSPVPPTWRDSGTLYVDASSKRIQKETVNLSSHDQGIKQRGLMNRRRTINNNDNQP